MSRLCAKSGEQGQALLNRPPERAWPYVRLDGTRVKMRRAVSAAFINTAFAQETAEADMPAHLDCRAARPLHATGTMAFLRDTACVGLPVARRQPASLAGGVMPTPRLYTTPGDAIRAPAPAVAVVSAVGKMGAAGLAARRLTHLPPTPYQTARLGTGA